MKLTFDPDFDRGAWPGPLAARNAVEGEEWVGEAGLLGRLETALGVGGPVLSRAERAAALVPRLRSVDGFWSASAEVDPLGTASRLLEWRDELCLCGWRGEVPPDSGGLGEARRPRPRREVPADSKPLDLFADPLPAGGLGRLRQLADVTRDALPGVPDRLHAVAAALEWRRAEIEEVAHFVALEELAPLWRTALGRLAARGTALRRLDSPPVPSSARDLHAARVRPFAPRGDASLQLVRPYGPLAAAEEIAAWLAAQPGLQGVLVLGADAALDAALRRHGLPTTGATRPPRENLLLQILPLALELAWSPADPQRALELLTLPIGPVPRTVAWRLVRALHEWPALDSPHWRDALRDGLAELPEERRERPARRIGELFASPVSRAGAYPAAEVLRRVATLETWARARRSVAMEPAEEARWQPPLDQLAALTRLLALSGLRELSAAQLQWFVEAATAATDTPPPCPAEAGIATVGEPGAMAGPARAVVWWNFTLDSAPSVRRLPFSPGERAALAARGVELPDPGAQALRFARRARQPFLQAREALLLVAPRRRENGDEDFPHPLWDELAAGLSATQLQILERALPDFPQPPARRAVSARPPVRPRRDWLAPAGAIAGRRRESPSSLAALLGCSFKWSVEHAAGIRPGETGPLPGAEQLAGKLAHEILSRVLAGPLLEPQAARALAERLFEEDGPRLAAAYFLPGADAARGEARRAVALAAKVLAEILGHAGVSVEAAEQEFICALGPWRERLAGRPDLVIGPPRAVLDLKWGWPSGRRRELETGTALQLAAYSLMLRRTPRDAWPPVAYFILKTQQLLTTAPAAFGGGERVDGPSPEATWNAVEAAHEVAWKATLEGMLAAPGNPDTAGEVHPTEDDVSLEGRLVVAPPCQFCDLGALCGLGLREEAGS